MTIEGRQRVLESAGAFLDLADANTVGDGRRERSARKRLVRLGWCVHAVDKPSRAKSVTETNRDGSSSA